MSSTIISAPRNCGAFRADIYRMSRAHDDDDDNSELPVRLVDNDPRPTSPRSTTHAHAHAHPHAAPSTSRLQAGQFPHEKLDAYQVALRMAALATKLAVQIPRGQRNLADHLLRAASNTVLLLGEGANRRGAASKRQRFADSRGECGEVAAAADLLLAMAIGSPADAQELKQLASRVSAMLTRLIARLEP